MKKLFALLLVLAVTTTYVGCAKQAETPADKGGDAPAAGTDTPAGDTPADDAPAGDAPAGDAPAGDTPADDAPAGDAPAGDAPADENN